MNWVNYDEVIAQLRSAGLLVDTLLAADIGTRRRVRVDGDREKRGWYHLHELRRDDGGTVLVGTYGVWRGTDPGTLKVELKGMGLSRDQQDALRQRIRDDQARELARRRAEGERAARRATQAWEKLANEGHNDYLTRKGVQAFGVRFSPQGAMCIPMLDTAGQIHGLQLIYAKGSARAKRLERDKDFWPTGLVKQGHFFLIGGSPAAASVLLVAEGYATGASLHMATGLPVAVAFDAGNLLHVCKALKARYRNLRMLVCADDDIVSRCHVCKQHTLVADPVCSHCGQDHGASNAGARGAECAALAVDGAWMVPTFAAQRPTQAKGVSDFNDLHAAEGLHVVRAQVDTVLAELGWQATAAAAAPAPPPPGEGDAEDSARMADLAVVNAPGELMRRFAIVYEMSETAYDGQEHKLVPLSSVRNLCVSRQVYRAWMEGCDKRLVRLSEVGFDPSGLDPRVKCNLWGGWPTRPRAGDCSKLLQLGEYLCSDDARGADLWAWMLKWLALPIQRPGTKMKTALVLHGPQGTGKNLFFEQVMSVYGEYGRVIDQEALEDKFNDTFSRKLFLVADEVVARSELYKEKNKLKSLVTGTEIRINPKNVGAYFECNCLNLVFLSNEAQPMVLERDDRRYCIIWTPPKLEPSFYNAVLREIEAGGVAALHDHLLRLDLGDFGPATPPPETQAKRDLIELSLDSSERFYIEWLRGELAVPVGPARTEDLYEAYRAWCGKQGVMKPAQLSTLVGALVKRPGVVKARKRHFKNHSQTVETQSTLLVPPGTRLDDLDITELSHLLATFGDAAAKLRRPTGLEGGGRGRSRDNGDDLDHPL